MSLPNDKARCTGAGRGQGIKASDGATGLKRVNVTLDPDTIDILRDAGDGQLSLGIRRAGLLWISKTTQSDKKL